MAIAMRNYTAGPRYGEDYHRIRQFLLEVGDIDYPFGRWDWMVSHSYLDEQGLPKIGIWEDGGEVVGLAVYDTQLNGQCYFPLKKGYDFLRRDMIAYAQQALAANGSAMLLIPDWDGAFQQAAAGMGYRASGDRECTAAYPIHMDKISYSLPTGFSITSMAQRYDLYQYGRVLWNGFNHELNGEGQYDPSPETLEVLAAEFERPNVNRELKIAVVSPEGNFVSYCGMWQDSASQRCLVEPVATDPAYRKMGLGRAAVLEAIRRCGMLGAKLACVGSSQLFYYSIGFRPFHTSTFWLRKGE